MWSSSFVSGCVMYKRTERTVSMKNASRHQAYCVSGVCCATEEAVVRKHLDAIAGPEGYRFNATTSELYLADASKEHDVVQKLEGAGFTTRRKSDIEEPRSFVERHGEGIRTAVAALFAVSGMLIGGLGGPPTIKHIALAVAIVVGGWRIFPRAWKSLRVYALDMNVLMSVAVIGAVAIGKWSEGAAVVILFAVSLMLESYSATRARRAIQSLMNLSPQEAHVVSEGGEQVVLSEELVPGQMVLVRPGERIPADGIVTDGTSSVDESVITGESVHIFKGSGAPVYGGSINQNGALRITVTRRHEESTLARIIHLVENAQMQRAPVQRFVDKFARVYTPAVLLVAVVVAEIPPVLLGGAFSEWLYRALVLLVIACPCALVISTPMTIVSILTRASRMGILVKGGVHIESLANLRAIAFDKTGTLTSGVQRVTDVVTLNSLPRAEILQIVGALEHRSEHSVGSALLQYVKQEAVEYSKLHVDGFEALPGRGVKGRIDERVYFLGNHRLCEEYNACTPLIEQTIENIHREGKTAIILGDEHGALCVLAVEDSVRESGRLAIQHLKDLGIHHITLLSGDNERSVAQAARAIGIDETRAGLLPEEKIAAVEKLKREHGVVAMVGDGVNDAPALAAASVGIAMGGSGTDVALETADVVLMGDDLKKLPVLIRLSRDTMRIIKQNIAIALILKLMFLVLSVSGVATLWMAVLADDGAALIVILNGLRMLSRRTGE